MKTVAIALMIGMAFGTIIVAAPETEMVEVPGRVDTWTVPRNPKAALLGGNVVMLTTQQRSRLTCWWTRHRNVAFGRAV
jgi:hypothetical protein